MSVIGPRPGLWNQDILTAERDKYNANDVKPGLTGWAQINGRDELEIPVKAKLDGEYVSKIGSDITEGYAGIADGSAVSAMPYIGLDITDKDAVMKTISEIKPDVVIHCAAWTAVDMAEDDDKIEKVRRDDNFCDLRFFKGILFQVFGFVEGVEQGKLAIDFRNGGF